MFCAYIGTLSKNRDLRWIIFKKLFFAGIFLLYPLVVQAGLFAYQDAKTQLWGFKDGLGVIVIAPQFGAIYETTKEVFTPKNKKTEHLVAVLKNSTSCRISRDGTVKFESVFHDNGPDPYEEGLARFVDPKTGKVGFHDTHGNIKIKPDYDFASPFRNGIANVCNGCHGEYPQIPTYPPISVHPYSYPLKEMYMDITGGTWGMIDKRGKIIVPIIYHSFEEAQKNKVSDIK